MRVGYLRFPQLSIQVARLRHPSLRGQPLIVGGDAASPGQVLDASEECLTAGVKRGMAIREALELIPSATCLPADPDRDAVVFEHALDLLERFSDVIEENGREGAWFVPAGPFPHAGTSSRGAEERRLGAAIVDGVAVALGLDVRAGIGPGKFVARIAAERAASGAVEVVDDREAAAYLAPLPINALPLLPRSIERLKLLGISTVGAFAQLPADALPRRFGPESSLAWRIARGNDDAPLVPRRRPETRSMRQTFEPPIEDRELLLTAARSLLDRVSRLLQEQGRAFRSLSIAIGLEDGRIVDQQVNLRAPTNDPRRCLQVLRAMIDALTLERSVASIAVRVEAIEHETAAQGELFDRARAERRERVAQSIAEIARRYRGRLRRIVPGDSPSSLFDDRRLLLLPYEPDGRANERPIGQAMAEPATRARPIRLIGQGKRIFLVEAGVYWSERDEIVALHARWEADDWWPKPTRRTYYRVRTRRGLIVTLAHDHERKVWLLVERFD